MRCMEKIFRSVRRKRFMGGQIKIRSDVRERGSARRALSNLKLRRKWSLIKFIALCYGSWDVPGWKTLAGDKFWAGLAELRMLYCSMNVIAKSWPLLGDGNGFSVFFNSIFVYARQRKIDRQNKKHITGDAKRFKKKINSTQTQTNKCSKNLGTYNASGFLFLLPAK